VIGREGVLRDRPGFEVDFVTRASASEETHVHDRASVLMPVRGHWRLFWDGGESWLAPGDTAMVPAGLRHGAYPVDERRSRALPRRRHRRSGRPHVEGLTPEAAIRFPYAIHTRSIRR
jgi:mannose-6-phosphate isomerase-like protein (cupin superfamily)